jgi:hypothetical protein
MISAGNNSDLYVLQTLRQSWSISASTSLINTTRELVMKQVVRRTNHILSFLYNLCIRSGKQEKYVSTYA